MQPKQLQTLRFIVESSKHQCPDDNEQYLLELGSIVRHRERALDFIKESFKSDEVVLHIIASDLLAHLCNPLKENEKDAIAATVRLLIELTDASSDQRLLLSAAHTFGFCPNSPKAVSALIKLSEHPSVEVKIESTRSLASTLKGSATSPAINRLIALASDKNGEIRSWALFGLGTQTALADIFSKDIEKVLLKHIDDRYPEARDEAIMGLAYRHNPEGAKCLHRLLKKNDMSTLNLEAAGVYGLPIFYDDLVALRERQDDQLMLLDWAIKRCSSDPSIRSSVAEIWV